MAAAAVVWPILVACRETRCGCLKTRAREVRRLRLKLIDVRPRPQNLQSAGLYRPCRTVRAWAPPCCQDGMPSISDTDLDDFMDRLRQLVRKAKAGRSAHRETQTST